MDADEVEVLDVHVGSEVMSSVTMHGAVVGLEVIRVGE